MIARIICLALFLCVPFFNALAGQSEEKPRLSESRQSLARTPVRAYVQSPVRAEQAGLWAPSARELFKLLPATIFENTLEGLNADDKERLLLSGISEYWILLPDSFDSLELVSLPFGDTRVFLHVYRYDNGAALALIGSNSEEICTLELWRMDANGNFGPIDAPQEPPVTDFFGKGNKMPKDVQASILFCLDSAGLAARAAFWNEQGMAHVPVDNELRFDWNGKDFKKRIVPVQHP